jgi:hypothetical protein
MHYTPAIPLTPIPPPFLYLVKAHAEALQSPNKYLKSLQYM